MGDYDTSLLNPLIEPLTQREREIVSLIVDGQTNREIGAALHLAEATIRWHNTQIFDKLGVKTRRQAVARAQELRLLDAETEAPTPHHNLPWQPSRFVGRHQEMSEVARLLSNTTIRLITILGAGGMGKTRLALEAARTHLSRFADGVYFVPFASIRSTEHIATAIAEQIGLQFHSESAPPTQLLSFLAPKQMLLVLDNFEHLLDGAHLVTDILQAAPQVKVLVTSREKLNLSGETIFTLAGLHFPDMDTPTPPLEYDAVLLLIESAQRVRPDFALQPDDFVDLARICKLTAGMPLALVLAASWLDMLTLKQIAAAIQQGIDILKSEMRDLPERQRSVRATLDYSWARLSDSERDVFRKLSVFRGGFTADAAQVVARATIRHLRRLIDQSLVQALLTGRYDIHELVRQYAAEQLELSGEAHSAGDAHSSFYLGFVKEREADIKGRRQRAALDEIEADFENVRAAWDWALERMDLVSIGDGAEALALFLSLRGSWKDKDDLFLEAINRLAPQGDETPHPVWGKVVVRGPLIAGAMAQTDLALEMARQHADKAEIAHCLFRMGLLDSLSKLDQTSLRLLEESAVCFQEVGDSYHVANALYWAGILYRLRGEHTPASAYSQQSLDLRRTIGDHWGMAFSVVELGMALFVRGNLDEAERCLREAYLMAKNERASIGAWLGIDLGGIYALGKQGNIQEARALVEVGLSTAPEVTMTHIPRLHRALALNFLSLIECMNDNYAKARTLGEEAQGVAFGDPWEPMYRWGLLAAMCGQQDYAAAAAHTRFLLQHFLARRVDTWLLVGVAFVAILTAYRDHAAGRATELLALAFSHRHSLTGWLHVWSLTKELQEHLKTELGQEAYHAAWERGKMLDLETVVRDLLANYGE